MNLEQVLELMLTKETGMHVRKARSVAAQLVTVMDEGLYKERDGVERQFNYCAWRSKEPR